MIVHFINKKTDQTFKIDFSQAKIAAKSEGVIIRKKTYNVVAIFHNYDNREVRYYIEEI